MKKEETVKLISAEGFEFVIDKKAAMGALRRRSTEKSRSRRSAPPFSRRSASISTGPCNSPAGRRQSSILNPN
ncbi:hypothetical protein MRB53_032786 [Persea americana]|uniref:Uncharacterized protein n=1 Tax=Persea americana TaxID=3435 RepID=A0ACC2KSW8_PERAE|nr:hypothetical protein MRB53_032786 [Persea americana]